MLFDIHMFKALLSVSPPKLILFKSIVLTVLDQSLTVIGPKSNCAQVFFKLRLFRHYSLMVISERTSEFFTYGNRGDLISGLSMGRGWPRDRFERMFCRDCPEEEKIIGI